MRKAMATILHRLNDWAEATPNDPAQRYKLKTEWKTLTAREYVQRVYYLALFLESKGISRKQTSAIFAYNSIQWVHLELAMGLMGGESAGIYTNSSQKDIQYVLNHTQAVVLGVQNKTYLKKI